MYILQIEKETMLSGGKTFQQVAVSHANKDFSSKAAATVKPAISNSSNASSSKVCKFVVFLFNVQSFARSYLILNSLTEKI